MKLTRISHNEWLAPSITGRIAKCRLNRGRLVEFHPPAGVSWIVNISQPDVVRAAMGMDVGSEFELTAR